MGHWGGRFLWQLAGHRRGLRCAPVCKPEPPARGIEMTVASIPLSVRFSRTAQDEGIGVPSPASPEVEISDPARRRRKRKAAHASGACRAASAQVTGKRCGYCSCQAVAADNIHDGVQKLRARPDVDVAFPVLLGQRDAGGTARLEFEPSDVEARPSAPARRETVGEPVASFRRPASSGATSRAASTCTLHDTRSRQSSAASLESTRRHRPSVTRTSAPRSGSTATATRATSSWPWRPTPAGSSSTTPSPRRASRRANRSSRRLARLWPPETTPALRAMLPRAASFSLRSSSSVSTSSEDSSKRGIVQTLWRQSPFAFPA